MNRNNPANLTVQLANKLKDAIHRGDYLPGHPIPSERELSENNNLSRTTVRRAIEMLADEGILFRKPGAGTYVGQVNNGQMLDATLGLIVPTLTNPYYGEFCNVIENYANEQGYQVLIGQSDYTNARETAYLMRYAKAFAVKGVIVVPNIEGTADGAYEFLASKHKPFVFAGRNPGHIEADTVSSDYAGGAKKIVSHLLDLGHTQIAYIRGRPHFPDDPLLAGYLQAFEDAGIHASEDHILLLDEEAMAAGLNGVRRLTHNRTDFSAIFARNDLTASGVLRGLAEVDLRVPEDIAVAGFDHTDLSQHLQPPLTTVDTTLQEVARQATTMLFDRINETFTGPARRMLIETRLIIRKSTRL